MGLGKADVSWTVLVPDRVPEALHPRWAVVGRSNVGKSSLLNALTHPRKLFKTGGKPGVTIGLIAVVVQVAKPPQAKLELVDLPGWGFAKRHEDEKKFWAPLSEALNSRSGQGLFWLLLADPLRDPQEEENAFLKWLNNQPFALVFTKSDRVKPQDRAAIEKRWQSLASKATEGPYWVSSQNGEGVDILIKSARDFTRLHT